MQLLITTASPVPPPTHDPTIMPIYCPPCRCGPCMYDAVEANGNLADERPAMPPRCIPLPLMCPEESTIAAPNPPVAAV
ncbi:hypothetical protein DL89DRAFT_270473 [Linderina pennispora]|uniref:Uncharacterized protein n=1 Tax=Linderina pennispora TaxID=61395 RepID=A0A1Y1VX81_9FUNG|nr:uncharacterized protein DL89DRAFT_270473 [Linderina pennispora]ORX65908.1 hypothetical protein DL89DRAFT_270473 [Linderina pennispora]